MSEVQFRDRQVRVPVETDDIAQALLAPTRAILKAKANDGEITKEEILAAVTESVDEVLAAIDGADKVGQELEQALDEFINAWVVMGLDIKSEVLAMKKSLDTQADAGARQ